MQNTQPQIVRHGEVILKPIPQLPNDATLSETTHKRIVAHSETGHHHVLEAEKGNDFKIFTTLDGKTFIELPTEAKLWHQKTGDDVHKTHTIAPAIYEVVIKREFDYFAGIIRQVRD